MSEANKAKHREEVRNWSQRRTFTEVLYENANMGLSV